MKVYETEKGEQLIARNEIQESAFKKMGLKKKESKTLDKRGYRQHFNKILRYDNIWKLFSKNYYSKAVNIKIKYLTVLNFPE